MNQTININQKNIQHYLKDIKKQLLLTHPMEDLTMHFSDYTSLNDIELYNTDSKILEEKLNHSRTIKKIAFFVLLLVVLAFIIYAILCVKTYIDIQNSIDAYKVIEIN